MTRQFNVDHEVALILYVAFLLLYKIMYSPSRT